MKKNENMGKEDMAEKRKNTKEIKSEWEGYWNLKSIEKKIIEFMRTIYFSKIIANLVEKHCTLNNKCKVLEAGCGTGKTARGLSDRIQYFGCDYSHTALQFASLQNRNLCLCDIKKLPFKDNSLDLIFNQGVMEHFTSGEFRQILNEFKRVASKVLVIVPGNLSVFQLYDPFKEPDKIFYSKSMLKTLLKTEFNNVVVKHLPQMFFLSIAGYGEAG